MEVFKQAYTTKIINVLIFMGSLVTVLRTFDILIKKNFSVSNLHTSVYYGLRFFAVAIALALIIM